MLLRQYRSRCWDTTQNRGLNKGKSKQSHHNDGYDGRNDGCGSDV